MSSSTPLHLPPSLPYPIKIVSYAVQPSANIERGTRLLTYSFEHRSRDTGPETRFATWDSPIAGTVDSWVFKLNEPISARKSVETPAIKVTEPCKHDIQLHGLCCICGKDMTSHDYTGFSDASRASIQMTHDASGPTVSLEEAQRIERETAEQLRKVRKLSLIVDLDQTIVHATVDPTVGEWIAEGEAWEDRRSKREAEGAEPDSDDEVNPNWEALKDVKKFRLGPEALGQPAWAYGGPRGKPKKQSVEIEGCMYYIKPRPGYKEFLEAMATKYEMHVYTMGTRAYAEEVCAAIDPDGKVFGGRVLSRDESGSMTQKSLQRLFPCDQSMVVIIDDRADVWEWSPNLVKVVPYDFFVGIGDINSAFLPKQEPSPLGILPESVGIVETPSGPVSPPIPPPPPPVTAVVELIPEEGPGPEEDELAEMRKIDILARNAAGLDAQVEQRPLAKMQEELEEQEEKEEAEAEAEAEAAAAEVDREKEGEKHEKGEKAEGEKVDEEKEKASNGEKSESEPVGKSPEANGAEISRSTTPKSEKHVKKALLKNNDFELPRVQKILEKVHQQYYEAYDKRPPEDKSMRRKSSKHHPPHLLDYDVRRIIPELRIHILEGVHILFSSVIPLDTRPESADVWRSAEAFGAKCYTELNSRITHCVAGKRGTVKVDAARRQGGVKIVWTAWLLDSVALWQRQDETPYLIDPEPVAAVGPASPPSDPNQISSDPEPDADDWDEDRKGAGPDNAGLTLDEVDWDEINNEVDAAMNESDDEDEGGSVKSGRSGRRSENVSEDEWTDESNSIISSADSTPRRKRKRLRSLTPSDSGVNGGDLDALRSPLAKRKKLAAERSGASKLKEAISADDLEQITPVPEEEEGEKRSAPVSPGEPDEDEMEEEDSDDSEDSEEDEDDFLARELGEEEWG